MQYGRLFNLEIVVPGRAADQQAPVPTEDQTPTSEETSSNTIRLYEKDETLIEI